MHIVPSPQSTVPHPNLVTNLSRGFKESIKEALPNYTYLHAIPEKGGERLQAIIAINMVIFTDFLVLCTKEGSPIIGDFTAAHEYRALEEQAINYYKSMRSSDGVLSVGDYLTDLIDIVDDASFALRYMVEPD